jgi:bifunctional non-homologous end joining protein LigD
MPLKLYRQKRDFKKTPEPSGKKAGKNTGSKAGKKAGAPTSHRAPRFVIQKHAASHLHYDFRLELDGVLKSWAVPKGPPFAKGDKRLAMEVEDHPVSYMTFEGTIPKGQYGGGTVMVWDIGTFEPLSKSPLKDLAGGKLHFVLTGKKLKGEWYLVRTRRGEERNQWLLIRGGADMKPVSKKGDDTSALSGKSMKQLEKGAVWNPDRAARGKPMPEAKKPRPPAKKNIAQTNARPGKLLPFFEPMKAKLVTHVPEGDWQYEIKLDGYRALAFLEAEGKVNLLSRNNKDLGRKFPEVADALRKLKTAGTVLDGEIVALTPKGHSSFQLLQRLELGQAQPPLLYCVFDMPQHEGNDLRALPLEERRTRLEAFLRASTGRARSVAGLRFSETVGDDGEKLLREAKKLGLEGLIGKRDGSLYESGRRSGAWIKLKTHREQEFVIGGYTDPGGSRRHFGALLVGVYEGKQLVFSGKVGAGFNDALLQSLRRKFNSLARASTPFVNLPESKAGRYGSGVTAAEMKRCHWVKPALVAQIKFSEWTQDGKLRQPVFLGLREDKDAKDVRREEKAHAG